MIAEADAGVRKKAKKQVLIKDDKQNTDKKRKWTADGVSAAEASAKQQPSGAPPAAVAAPTAAAEAAAAASGPARKKQRRHKRGGNELQQQLEALDPQEALRRQRQRELRELAFKMRAQGKTYVPPRKGSQPRSGERGQNDGKDDKGGGGKGGSGKGGSEEGRKGRHYLGDKTPGWRPFSSVEVIVLPIFWNNNKEEKAAVLAASERARDILASAGLNADMDASNKYTPGQKMKYWETMGVRVRVELGPRDVANGNCVVALSTKNPGEVAAKSVVNMRHKMLDAVRVALSQARAARDKAAEETEREEPEERQEGQQQAQGQQKGKKAAAALSQQQQRQAGSEEEENGDDAGSDGDGAADEDEEVGEEGGDAVVAAALAAVKSRQGGVLQLTANPEARSLRQQGGPSKPAEREQEAGGKKRPPKAVTPVAPHSADALEDDFGDLVEFEAEEDMLTLSKKERVKKAAKAARVRRKAEQGAAAGCGGGDGEEGGAERPRGGAAVEKAVKPKKPRVVTF